MTDEEREDAIRRMRQLANASIHGGWGDGAQEWLLKVAEDYEDLAYRLESLEK